MKKLIAIPVLAVVLSSFTLLNSIWKNDPPHSQLGFTVTHLGINDVSGTFNDFEVSINAQKADFSDAVFTLTAKTASVDTRVEARDNHLKSADFFDAAQYPEFSFTSTSIKSAGKNKFKLTGNLTLHGVTKEVSLDALYRGTVENPMSKKQTAGFSVTGTIKRSDFQIGSKFPDAMVSDLVQIKADGEFAQ
ncbi:MAG: YceI family protein [Candidatus Pseudobacter hemicellulosilyticus]|uniref:YceI family protein n=1 Tax=Candidatus Pseudobacter hemicellulosilyticus TaxID=3121375 RepID=A0AAJ5WZ36_9BACT|nr:MAG: YceI family protein [Pseudobacter sp.]